MSVCLIISVASAQQIRKINDGVSTEAQLKTFQHGPCRIQSDSSTQAEFFVSLSRSCMLRTDNSPTYTALTPAVLLARVRCTYIRIMLAHHRWVCM